MGRGGRLSRVQGVDHLQGRGPALASVPATPARLHCQGSPQPGQPGANQTTQPGAMWHARSPGAGMRRGSGSARQAVSSAATTAAIKHNRTRCGRPLLRMLSSFYGGL